MALYIPHSFFHLVRLLYVRPETFGPYYVRSIFNAKNLNFSRNILFFLVVFRKKQQFFLFAAKRGNMLFARYQTTLPSLRRTSGSKKFQVVAGRLAQAVEVTPNNMYINQQDAQISVMKLSH